MTEDRLDITDETLPTPANLRCRCGEPLQPKHRPVGQVTLRCSEHGVVAVAQLLEAGGGQDILWSVTT